MKQFGSNPSEDDLKRYAQSPQWKDGRFCNLEKTDMSINPLTGLTLLYQQVFQARERRPDKPLPILPIKVDEFMADGPTANMVWYGHSVLLMRMAGQTILIDPMLGEDASPIAPFKTSRFSENTLDLIDHLPPLDAVVLTHDHYDHLDLDSMKKVIARSPRFFVSLGIGRHLKAWGVPDKDIHEFDWWDTAELGDITITSTPTRHFSGRGLRDRAKSLWGGWAFRSDDEHIWFSGDGGYGNHFQEVGGRLGPFDFAIMECGQYSEHWEPVHLFPEQSIQAAKDAQAQSAMPVHWGGFSLAPHPWKDPIERFVAAAEKADLPIITPTLGEVFTYDSPKVNRWWEAFK
jgi:L-ascorbate metabolism protein UlaG (beta-lactamase superfamily)